MTNLPAQTRDKLLVALLIEDIVTQINTALKARKAVLGLDYSDNRQPVLDIRMPGTAPEIWLTADPRSKRCWGKWPNNRDLALTVRDINERLKKLDAHLAIGCAHRPNQKIEAKLQVFIQGSVRTAITLFAAKRGERKYQEHFLLPKELQ